MGSLSLASSVGKIIEQQEGCQMGGWLCGARVGHGRPGGGPGGVQRNLPGTGKKSNIRPVSKERVNTEQKRRKAPGTAGLFTTGSLHILNRDKWV